MRKEPLTSDRSAFCKGSRESKVNDRRQSWGAGGPQGGRLGHQPGLSTLPPVGLSQPGPTDPAGIAEEEEVRLLEAGEVREHVNQECFL